MTLCNDVEAQLSQMVDGQLPDAAAQATVRAHLEECASCRGVLQDLERLRRTSRALGPVTPPEHLWLEVAGQLRLGDEQTPVEVPHRAMPIARGPLVQWIGLAAALLVVTIGVYYFNRPTIGPATIQSDATSQSNAAAPGTVEAIAEELKLATSHYENAIAQLEAMAKSDNGTLDPATAKTLQDNIRKIDVAIAESRNAVTQDPGSVPARESLFDALQRKISVLQATVTLMNEMRKGNQAGAAEALAAFGKKS